MKKISRVFFLSAKNEISTFLLVSLAHSSDMPFSKELPDLIITDAKGIEGTEFLTKCAQHLPERDFSNAFVYRIFPSQFSR